MMISQGLKKDFERDCAVIMPLNMVGANLHQGPNPKMGSPRGRIYACSQTALP